MKNYLLIIILLFLAYVNVNAQQKIGGNPLIAPNGDALLELGESSGATKGLLISRVALQATNSADPLTQHVAGMIVYNTASTSGNFPVEPGLYINDGTQWLKMGTIANDGALYGNGSDIMGTGGITVTRGGTRAALVATELSIDKNALADMISENPIIDSITNNNVLRDTIVALAQRNVIGSGSTSANNGLQIAGSTIQLGGELIKPTTIRTSSSNTLAITGLLKANPVDSMVLVSHPTTGVVSRKPVRDVNFMTTYRTKVLNGQSSYTLEPDVNVIRIVTSGGSDNDVTINAPVVTGTDKGRFLIIAIATEWKASLTLGDNLSDKGYNTQTRSGNASGSGMILYCDGEYWYNVTGY